jgi:ADP-heptose:LPS heptosyltransferase
MQKLNVIDKRKMLNGISYMFSTSKELTEAQMDALILVRDTMRKAGLLAAADNHGRIIVQNRDKREVAIGLFI